MMCWSFSRNVFELEQNEKCRLAWMEARKSHVHVSQAPSRCTTGRCGCESRSKPMPAFVCHHDRAMRVSWQDSESVQRDCMSLTTCAMPCSVYRCWKLSPPERLDTYTRAHAVDETKPHFCRKSWFGLEEIALHS